MNKLFLHFTILLLPYCAFSQSTGGKGHSKGNSYNLPMVELKGIIKDRITKQGISATIRLYDTSSVVQAFTVADGEGFFKFLAPYGCYHLVAVAPEYVAEETPISLDQNTPPVYRLKKSIMLKKHAVKNVAAK